MATNGLHGLYIVGTLEWRDGIARPTLCSTKTRARQLAEVQLHKASRGADRIASEWREEFKDWKECFRLTDRMPRSCEAFCQWVERMHRDHGMRGDLVYRVADYRLCQTGIPLTGPDGTETVIRTVSRATERREKAKAQAEEKRIARDAEEAVRCLK